MNKAIIINRSLNNQYISFYSNLYKVMIYLGKMYSVSGQLSTCLSKTVFTEMASI
jgi:hypothetical protein